MAARFSRLIWAPLALLGIAARELSAQAAESPAGWRQVVTAEQIRRAGVMRLGELVRLADAWDVTTVDEFTWRGAPAGLAPIENEVWKVLLDGQPVEPGLLGVMTLERLPIDLGMVDSVVFVAAPRLEAGVFSDGGLIEVYTARPTPGATFRARFATGSETGDPGPFAFVPPAAGNRDRFGHDASLGAAYAGSGWYAAAGLGLATHIATDPAIVDRLYVSGGGFPRIERTAPSLRLGVDHPGGRHRLLVGRVTLEDWFRLDAFGAELPARSTLTHAGLDGTIALRNGGETSLRYTLGVERSTLDSRELVIAPALDLARSSLRGMLELGADRGALSWRAGASLARDDVRSAYSLRDNPFVAATAHGGIEWSPAPRLRQSAALSVSTGAGHIGGGFTLEHAWRPGDRDEIALLLAASRPLPEEDAGLWTLLARGFRWLPDVGVPVALESDDARGALASADLAWRRVVRPGLALSAGGFYRVFDGEYVSSRSLAFDSLRLAWRGPVRVDAAADGAITGVRVGAEAQLARRLRLRAWYRAQELVSGDEAVHDVWLRLPRHAARIDATFTPVADFALWGRLDVASATRWIDYAAVEAGGGVSSRLPATLAVDLGAEKWFWHRRLRGHLGVRNAFNAERRFHPEGGATGLAFVFQLEATLPGGR